MKNVLDLMFKFPLLKIKAPKGAFTGARSFILTG